MSPFVPGYQPPPMDKVAQAATGRARTMALPPLPAGTPDDEHVSVAQAAELLVTSQQSINKSIVDGVLPAYRLEGMRRVLVADLATTQTGRAQAEQAAEERRRRGWLANHLAGDVCQGRGCRYFAHEPVKRPASPKLLAHLARIRVLAQPINEAHRLANIADIEQGRARLRAEEPSS